MNANFAITLAAATGILSLAMLGSASSGSLPQIGKAAVPASANIEACDFWLHQAGDQAMLAVKHSYCIRRNGF